MGAEFLNERRIDELAFQEKMKEKFKLNICGFDDCEFDPVLILKMICNDPDCQKNDDGHLVKSCIPHFLNVPEEAIEKYEPIRKEDGLKILNHLMMIDKILKLAQETLTNKNEEV